MPPVLYPRERQILEFCAQFISRHGYAPTLREIGDSVGLSSVATVHEHISKLERKGFIKKLVGSKRGIEIVREATRFEMGDQGLDLPVLGYVAAGSPLEPHTDPNLYLQVAPWMVTRGKTAYVLQVKGESMIEDGILDGDYVVIQHQTDAKNGDIVVAILSNGLATLKRIFFEPSRVRLEPANSKMAPIFTTEVKIQGIVVGLIRKFQKV
ncbi:transcriptional repressor LexA [Candidatus Gottesmanbacteria bacterium]|nr:transcriptional repressor LexA [Candidatus Gottesmanbacteria bacterium]